ncbi:carotenoid oxygenase family protein [Pusillimonas noertemannii]|nr:carotenoid oxygenase family protein [Pusillimonas noertemannii]TFL12261.1 carotenoid oxygenase family protein [Pusillimonas noertemannii]
MATQSPFQLRNMEPWTSDNPFLTRALAPVFDERDAADLAIEGRIPSGMRGIFMRNGPNPQFKPDDHYAYPFDGTGMIHAVYIEDGRARYQNRWVLTTELAEERAAGQRLYHSTLSAPPHANLANTNIIHHAGRYLALFEGGAPYELDRDLNTLGVFDYDGVLPGVMSAHPKVDPVSAELFSVQYDLETGELLYLRADKTGRIDRIVPFQSPWPAMVHDIALTQHHIVAFVCPLVFDFSRPGPPATWQPERGTMVALIPRDAQAAQDVQWINGPAFFHWHVINAHEEGDRIEVVVPWYDSFSLTGSARKLELHRMIIHADTELVEDQTIDDQACEFGRINDAYLGRKARYCYVGLRAPRSGETPQVGAFEAIARYDMDTGQKVVHQFPHGVTVGEPVFVAAPESLREDDGFIVTFIHEEGRSDGGFVILDARHIERGPMAVVRLPRRVPAGLHGSWTPM